MHRKHVQDIRMRILGFETCKMVIHSGYRFLSEFSVDGGRLLKRLEQHRAPKTRSGRKKEISSIRKVQKGYS